MSQASSTWNTAGTGPERRRGPCRAGAGALAVAVLSAGCGVGGGSGSPGGAAATALCGPGSLRVCACAGGGLGTELCAPDGAAYEGCACPAAPALITGGETGDAGGGGGGGPPGAGAAGAAGGLTIPPQPAGTPVPGWQRPLLCAPGSLAPCACPSGGTGLATCSAAGDGFGSCACGTTACAPGAQVSCACEGGTAGRATCDAAGSGLSPCSCPSRSCRAPLRPSGVLRVESAAVAGSLSFESGAATAVFHHAAAPDGTACPAGAQLTVSDRFGGCRLELELGPVTGPAGGLARVRFQADIFCRLVPCQTAECLLPEAATGTYHDLAGYAPYQLSGAPLPDSPSAGACATTTLRFPDAPVPLVDLVGGKEMVVNLAGLSVSGGAFSAPAEGGVCLEPRCGAAHEADAARGGYCGCAPGFHDGGDGVCVPDAPPAGESPGGAICSPGFHDSGRGVCFPARRCAGPEFVRDDATGACVPATPPAGPTTPPADAPASDPPAP